VCFDHLATTRVAGAQVKSRKNVRFTLLLPGTSFIDRREQDNTWYALPKKRQTTITRCEIRALPHPATLYYIRVSLGSTLWTNTKLVNQHSDGLLPSTAITSKSDAINPSSRQLRSTKGYIGQRRMCNVAGRASHPAMNAPCGRTSLSSTKLVPDFPKPPRSQKNSTYCRSITFPHLLGKDCTICAF